jgi:predicted amidohydrolase
MIVALASPRPASSLEDGLARVERLASEASFRGAKIVCFPEGYLPGLRGQDFEPFPFDESVEERVLAAVAEVARKHSVATIMGMEHVTDAGSQIVAFVIDAQGRLLGHQTKNQLDPTEDRFYVPGDTRRIFEIDGVKLGITICHEGWRYPETVRAAARKGAHIVFHPHYHRAEPGDFNPTTFADPRNTFHEKAALCRAAENTCWFATINYASDGSPTTSAVAKPDGTVMKWHPYGVAGLLVADIELEAATRLLAGRWRGE